VNEQIFVSYRRDGGDVAGKLICETLKNRGYTVFYDYDSICDGFFDQKIFEAIKSCKDFILILSKNSLDRCINENDWVRQEIACALKESKHIIPVMLEDFNFPSKLPTDIEDIVRINAVKFFMAYFEGVIYAIEDRLISKPITNIMSVTHEKLVSENLEFSFQEELKGYSVAIGKCTDVEIRIPESYDGKLVVSIAEEGFKDCSALKTVVLPKTLKHIGECAFHGCTLLENIIIPSNVTDIGRWAFYKCSSIKHIIIPKDVKNIGARAFADCTSLSSFEVDKENRYFCSCDENLYTKDRSIFVAYACGKNEQSHSIPEGVKTIEDCAFSNASSLLTISLPNSVTQIEKFAFCDCVNLEAITLPNFATSIGDFAFKNCSSLVSVTIPKGVQTIGEEIFRNCSALKTVVLPKTLKIIGNCAFYECTSLENIIIPSNVTDIGRWAFYGCSSIRYVTIPKGVKNIEARAFANCSSLKEINVSYFNHFYRSDKRALFTKDMKKLLVYAIGLQVFSYKIPNNINIIDDSAFSHSLIESITISGKVTDIEEFSFYECVNLKTINFDGTVDMFKKINVKNNSFSNAKTNKILCSDGVVEI